MHTAFKQSHRVPQLCIYHLKRRRFVTSYSMFNPLRSSTNQKLFKKNFCNLSGHYIWKLRTISITNGSHHVPITKLTLLWWTKMNGTQRRAVVSPRRMHCMYSDMAKGTSGAEVTLNSEKIKPIALAIVELHKTEVGRQAVSQAVSQYKIP